MKSQISATTPNIFTVMYCLFFYFSFYVAFMPPHLKKKKKERNVTSLVDMIFFPPKIHKKLKLNN